MINNNYEKILAGFFVIIFAIISNLQLSGQDNTPVIVIPDSMKYLNRPLPGVEPVRFPPDSLLATDSWWWHGSPVFSPDMSEMYWSIYRQMETGNVHLGIWCMKYDFGSWGEPYHPSFADTIYSNYHPVLSDSGNSLYFISSRPEKGIYLSQRTISGWADPEVLDIPLPENTSFGSQFSIANNGNLYFELWGDNFTIPPDIYKSEFINGSYLMPVIQPELNTVMNDFAPYIDPFEQYVLFISNRTGGFGYHDIYLSVKNTEGNWERPVNLGEDINTDFEDFGAWITPDNKYFFFDTQKAEDIGYNPYWMDASVIFNMITGIEKNDVQAHGIKLHQNYPNPFNDNTEILFEIQESGKFSFDIFDTSGKLVFTVFNEKYYQSGKHQFNIKGALFSNGLYTYILSDENEKRVSKRMIKINQN